MHTFVQLLTKLINMFWEFRLGINSRGVFDSSVGLEAHGYSTVSYYSTFHILRRLRIGPTDIFFDIGCGKGRVLCCVQRCSPQKVVGIELNKDLCNIARSNLKKMMGRKSPYEIINSSATDCDYSSGTIFYLFNPFGRKTLSEVLQRIKKTLKNNPRKIKFVYVNSVFNDIFQKSDWLVQFDCIKENKISLFHNTTFWESKL